MTYFFDELRYGLRGLCRTPTFTVAALLSLTLGIATTALVFSLIDAAIWRLPPFPEADRLAVLNITQRTPREGELKLRWSWRRFELLRDSVRSFEAVASSSNNVLTITGVDDPEPLPLEIVSPGYFRLMRTPFVTGGGFSDNGGKLPDAFQIVLGYDLWRRRFNGANDVVGRILHVNGTPLTITGVAASGFAGVSGLAQAWVPPTLAPRVSYRDYLVTNQNFITVIGRLRPNVTLEAARGELAAVGPRIHAEQPSDADSPDDQFSATAMLLNDARIDVVTRRALMLLAGAVAVLLFIACANVASLLLGRGAERRRELAIRLALGARAAQLMRQLLAESTLIAAGSGLLTLAVLLWTVPALRIPQTLARGRNFYGAVGEFATPILDWRLLAFTFVVSACTVILFGLLPAVRATHTNVDADLRSSGTRATTSGGSRSREAIVAFQLALALVLVVGCGLLLASYARLRSTSLGFDPDRLLTFMIRPSEVKYAPESAPRLVDRVLEEIARVPVVESATVDGCAPVSTQCANGSLQIVGRPWPASTEAPLVLRHYVAPSHFETLRVPIVRGRALTAADTAGRPRVVVINQAAAERFWPNADPIGKRIWFEGAPNFATAEESAEIVGIAGNVAYQPLDERPIQPDFFTPYAQFTYASRMVIVRTRGEPLAAMGAIAQAVRRADPDLALFDAQTMESRAQLSWAKHGFSTVLFAIIGGIALFLAVTGVYAVTAHLVASRSREIGVRMALGANSFQIARTSVRQTVRLGIAGMAFGVAGAFVLSRLMRAMLYDTSPADVRVFAGAVVVLIAAMIAATWIPVRRALRVDPIEVLRTE
jgi:putative ABC transport system permease protein